MELCSLLSEIFSEFFSFEVSEFSTELSELCSLLSEISTELSKLTTELSEFSFNSFLSFQGK